MDASMLSAPAWHRDEFGPVRTAPELIHEASADFDGLGPWSVELQHGVDGERVRFRVDLDGSVHMLVKRAWTEVGPAGSVPAPKLLLLPAHYYSGVSTWAHLLAGEEVTEPDENRRALVVARTTLAGIESAKPFTQGAGAVLLVADAAGKVSPEVRRAIRVLEGGAPVIRVPWVSALRGVIDVPSSAAVKAAAAKVAADVRKKWRGR